MKADSLYMGPAEDVHAHVHICSYFSDDSVTGRGNEWPICAKPAPLSTTLCTNQDIGVLAHSNSNAMQDADGDYSYSIILHGEIK